MFELLWELLLRDIKVRYMRSYLGIGWSLLNPLGQIIIFSFLFKSVMPLSIPNYTVHVFCGILAWSWFSASLIGSAGVVISSPELIRRPGFPMAILPVLSVMTNCVQFLLAAPLLLPLAIADGGRLGWTLLAIPIIIATQFVLTLALTFPLAAINVRYRDTQHVIALVTTAGFYMTPVFYSVDLVPERFRPLYLLNPVATLLDAYRDVLIRNEWPDFGALLIIVAIAVPVIVIGHSMFLRAGTRFAEEL